MAAQYISDQLGSLSDSVRLMLGNDEIRICESWDIVEGILAQPSAWNITLGHSEVAAALLQKYPPGTPFKLYIGDVLQLSGVTDGRAAVQSQGGGTTIRFKGRDALAPLHDTYVAAQESFNNATYADLVRRALTRCGLDPSKLVASNDANRQAKAGIPIKVIPNSEQRTVDEIIAAASLPGAPTIGIVEHQQQAKVNETWLTFIRRHIDKAGLFLWAAADGTFVLAQPDGNQAPVARFIRHTGDPTAGGNVVAMDFQDDVTHRHSEAILYGRGGGKKHGRPKSKGAGVDDEMFGYGYTSQPIVFRDVNVQNTAEAEYFANRKLAEERREGWRLSYTVAGHTLPAISGNGAERVVLTPDSCIEVDDQELGIKGVFYLETVERRRSTGTTTTIHLMRLQDLIFGGSDE